MRSNSINTAFFTAGIVAYGAGLCLLFAHVYGFDVVFVFLEKHISPDQHIRPTGRRLLAQAITNSATGLFILGTFSFACTKETFRLQIARLTMTDELATWNSKTPDPFFIFILSSLIGITVITLYGLRPMDGFLFKKEGFFETSTAILFAISSVLLAHTALAAHNLHRQLTSNYLLFFYLGIAVIFFFISMEEISWGQTIFGFETPDGYSQVSQQQETNLHNLLSRSYLNAISTIAVVIFSLALLIGWFLLLLAKRGSGVIAINIRVLL
jgi:hypothetical protein